MRAIIISITIFLCTITNIAFADFSYNPKKRGYYSENGQYLVHFVPSRMDGTKYPAIIRVSQVQTKQQKLYQWQCNLGSESSPNRCYITNNGQTVVTIDEWTGRGYGGYGKHALAFYNKDGVIKHYPAVEVLGYRSDIPLAELQKKIGPYTEDGIPWDTEAIEFLDEIDGVEYICMWLPLIEKWKAWEVNTGKSIKPAETMKNKWVEKARSKVLQYTKDGVNNSIYLGYLKRPEDRHLIEKALDEKGYSRKGIYSNFKNLKMFSASSSQRHKAEQILAAWDNGDDIYEALHIKMRRDIFELPAEEKKTNIELPYQLGWVEGVIELPELENPREAALWIYLISEGTDFVSCDKPPFYKIATGFKSHSIRHLDPDYTKIFPFRFEDVTPGKYRIKVILDRTDPPSNSYNPKLDLVRPGDYTNATEQLVEIQKGTVAKGLLINCTNLVK